MEITEKDLFLFVLFPSELILDKFLYLQNNYEKFREEIDMLYEIKNINLSYTNNIFSENVTEKIFSIVKKTKV